MALLLNISLLISSHFMLKWQKSLTWMLSNCSVSEGVASTSKGTVLAVNMGTRTLVGSSCITASSSHIIGFPFGLSFFPSSTSLFLIISCLPSSKFVLFFSFGWMSAAIPFVSFDDLLRIWMLLQGVFTRFPLKYTRYSEQEVFLLFSLSDDPYPPPPSTSPLPERDARWPKGNSC